MGHDKAISERVIGCAFEVSNTLGAGYELPESDRVKRRTIVEFWYSKAWNTSHCMGIPGIGKNIIVLFASIRVHLRTALVCELI